jgi:hypothetical protein
VPLSQTKINLKSTPDNILEAIDSELIRNYLKYVLILFCACVITQLGHMGMKYYLFILYYYMIVYISSGIFINSLTKSSLLSL